jgi:transcriptional regulator with XRE-family HTH domain
LRREEVALLAHISVEYYTQLERGNVRGVSEDVLEAVARALQLDEVERTHLFDLVRAAKRRPAGTGRTPERVRPGVQRVLDSITESAAFVRNGRLDILSANRLGYTLYSEAFANPDRPVNLARFVFLDQQSRTFYKDWEGIADAGVGNLRAETGRDPTIPTSPTSSASSPCEARISAPAGPPTTSASTAAAPSRSTTRSSVTSPSATRPSS